MGMLLCEQGYVLYMNWSHLLNRRGKKTDTDKIIIRKAEKAYIMHRRACKKCQPWIEPDKEKSVSVETVDKD
jgi:hypothetical protein